MKTAMKLTTGILAVAVMAGGVFSAKAAAQNPDAIDNARSVAKSLQQKQANDSNAALDAAGTPAQSAKPAPGAPAPAVKPALLPASKPAPQAAPAPAKNTATPAKPATAPAKSNSPAKPAVAAKAPAPSKPAAKSATTQAAAKPAQPAASEAKPAETGKAEDPFKAPSADDKKSDDKKQKEEDKKWAMNGKRDPFFSPVVQANGSGCSTGKKCLEIGQINLRGVVKSDNGFIAVVTNNLNKAYFLRENDPVFNGYVVRITGDSVVFQETVQDKLGKTFTREVVKKIYTPAV